MDHMHHEEDDDDETECTMSMIMHGGHCETILFRGWTAKSLEMFVLSTFVIFVVTIAYEGLKYYREKLYSDTAKATAKYTSKDNLTDPPPKSIREYMLNRMHFVQTALHLIQVTVSYALMLIVMTYNVYLVLAVVLGAAVGYFVFGWVRQRAVDTAEHCQ